MTSRIGKHAMDRAALAGGAVGNVAGSVFDAGIGASREQRLHDIRVPGIAAIADRRVQRCLTLRVLCIRIGTAIHKRCNHIGTELGVAVNGVVKRRIAPAVGLAGIGA